MTCIVALKHEGRIYMGADSAGVGGLSLRVRSDPKIYQVGEFLIGFTSSFRMGQLLGHKLSVTKQHPETEDYTFMCTTFIEAVRSTLKDGGYAYKKDEQELAGTFICGYKGNLYQIESDYQVGTFAVDYTACGCGEDIALGSLFSTEGDHPEDRIRTALSAAEMFSAGVRAPFLIKTM